MTLNEALRLARQPSGSIHWDKEGRHRHFNGRKDQRKSWHSPLIQSDRYLLMAAMSTDTGDPVNINLFFSMPISILVVMVFY